MFFPFIPTGRSRSRAPNFFVCKCGYRGSHVFYRDQAWCPACERPACNVERGCRDPRSLLVFVLAAIVISLFFLVEHSVP
jgi:hypothetical protein